MRLNTYRVPFGRSLANWPLFIPCCYKINIIRLDAFAGPAEVRLGPSRLLGRFEMASKPKQDSPRIVFTFGKQQINSAVNNAALVTQLAAPLSARHAGPLLLRQSRRRTEHQRMASCGRGR